MIRLMRKGPNLSRYDELRLKTMTTEYDAETTAEKIEVSRLTGLTEEQNDLYESAFP